MKAAGALDDTSGKHFLTRVNVGESHWRVGLHCDVRGFEEQLLQFTALRQQLIQRLARLHRFINQPIKLLPTSIRHLLPVVYEGQLHKEIYSLTHGFEPKLVSTGHCCAGV